MRNVLPALFFVMALLLMPSTALAQEGDARLTVALSDEGGQQGSPDASLLLKKALPVLWDRIVPRAQRHSASTLRADSRMVARIVPGREETVVEFNGERVFEMLREAHIGAIVTPPRFHLVISMRNNAGLEMVQTEALLEEEADHLAPGHGIELTDNGTGLVLVWRWLDAQHAELTVRGQSRLNEFVETREITDADSLPVLKGWLEEVLLKARDAYAYDADISNALTGGGAMQTDDGFGIELIVQRNSSLLEQVALEESLAHDPRVRQVLQLSLSRSVQRYKVQLEGGDTSWLGEWFARRGYRMDRLSDGSWVAH